MFQEHQMHYGVKKCGVFLVQFMYFNPQALKCGLTLVCVFLDLCIHPHTHTHIYIMLISVDYKPSLCVYNVLAASCTCILSSFV